MAKARSDSPLWLEICLSLAIASCWVAFYGYTYNVKYLNSPPLNWCALTLWASGLLLSMRVHGFLYKRFGALLISIPLVWCGYFACLLALEYTGYYILAVRLVTSEGPLLFGLIHGTATLKTFYIIAGPCAILLLEGMRRAMASFARAKASGRVTIDPRDQARAPVAAQASHGRKESTWRT
jgi:hypothetical protein